VPGRNSNEEGFYVRRKNLLVIALFLLLGAGLSSWKIPHVHAAPTFSVDLDGNSTSSTDVLVQASATQTKTFRVGAVINASSTNPLNNVFGWQFVINYNSTLVIPVGDPNPAGPYPDGASNAANFGAQNTAGSFNWQARVDGSLAFASLTVASPGRLAVFYALFRGQPSVTLSAKTLLANVAFEILTKTTSPQLFTITNVLFVDQNATPLPDNIVHGANATETITNDPPAARFTATQVSSYVYSFDATASTDGDGSIPDPAGYFWDFGDGTQDLGVSGSVVLNHDYTMTGAPGHFNVTLRVADNLGATGSARDSLGNMIINSQPSHTYHSVAPNKPPVASFTFSPASPAPPATVTFDGSASTDDGKIVKYHWDFGDGNTFDSCVGSKGCSNSTSASNLYTSPKNYTVVLTVTDDFGAIGSKAQNVIVNVAPTLTSLSLSTNPTAGQAVTLTITASDSDGSITAIKVDWGDGTIVNLPGTQTSPTHKYASSGNFQIAVTVTDDLGATSSKTTNISVNPGSGGGTFTLPGGPIPYIVIAIVAAAAVSLFMILRRRRSKSPPKTG
jgi:PKD repeat protein